MQARRCDACRKFYDNPVAPSQLDSKVAFTDTAPLKLGRGKFAKPFLVNVQVVPCQEGVQGQFVPVDLCPACRTKCMKGVAEIMAKFGAAKPQKGESPDAGRRGSPADQPGAKAPAAGKMPVALRAGAQGGAQPRKG